MSDGANLAVIILAAGKGTRMKSALPKVLHGFAGRPMLGHLLAALQPLKPTRTVVVTGFGAEAVETYCTAHFPGTEFVRQTEQRGTGHAVQVCAPLLAGHEGPVVIVYGDIMLNIRPDVLPKLMAEHAQNVQGLTLLAANVSNPNGFGRLFYNQGILVSIEEKDCDDAQRAITTVNPCIYAVHGPALWPLLQQLNANNAQNELYLTDIIELAPKSGLGVVMSDVVAEREEVGVNSRAELAAMDALWQSRKRKALMDSGVTLVGPETCFFSHDTQIGPDSTVGPFVVCGEGVRVAAGCVVKPYTHLEQCTVGEASQIGPFARLRPGAELAEQVHVGNFVEIKNSTLGVGAKANHLTYVGDASVGAGANLGAGTITANYNHHTKQKQRTVIGDGASTGSGTVLVAPATLGNFATTGANTVVRGVVGEHELLADKPGQIRKWPYPAK
jgi:bifunctional UDP-N-acetylglucosamine pyrophosphorylase / glucosamine-1-phosphate N-acetyltransferase